MITFTDDHEAELWRSTMAAVMGALSSAKAPTIHVGTAGDYADAAVLEYRKRCAPPIAEEGGPCGWCDPSYGCWTAGKPCVKIAKCPEMDR